MSIRERTAKTDRANREARARYLADKRRHERDYLTLRPTPMRPPDAPEPLLSAAANIAGQILGYLIVAGVIYWACFT